MDISRGGAILRLFVTAALTGGIVYGSLLGDDADWPFSPLKMYSSTHDLDSPVGSTQIYGTTADGEVVPLTHGAAGLSRAEFEGQLPLYRDEPERLAYVADAYDSINSGEELVKILIQIDYFEMKDGYVTGRTWTEDVVTWQK